MNSPCWEGEHHMAGQRKPVHELTAGAGGGGNKGTETPDVFTWILFVSMAKGASCGC